ncbi:MULTISPECIES: efflux RND transporter periplasmic adaptor subunit [Sporomusa]|uniref:efflux RND transporter periplasmic adaptor subunit n=1 Tax=Sporomusa TaxID=2375 RepID=UPI00166E56FA|nr:MULTISPECIES: efflux RND transporter periplasmic adaptor subunit [Sporomusa]MCM0761161.1 efflux RND transporter periplasmic adaptor subunit [Sporomusa sphaeroides DSM 2875]HML35003.1 efflux RND transporter periplasmic adaptor subunit [Sporomusa sphaeroides]
MTKRYAYVFFGSAIVLIGLLAGYGIYVNASSNIHVAKMTASQYVRVKGASVMFRDIVPVVYFPVVNIYSSKMQDVHFEIDGTLAKVFVKPGDRVRTGQLLGEIVNDVLPSAVLQAEGKIRSCEASVVKWENTLRRYQTLAAQNAISQQQLDEASTSLRAAEGELASARAYQGELITRLRKQQIAAPCDGDVMQVYHSPGTVVRMEDSLVMLSEQTSLYFRRNIASEVLEQLEPLAGSFILAVKRNEVAELAYVSPIKGGNSGGGNEFSLRIAEVSPPLATPAPYRTVEYHIDNSAGLLEPGTYYQIRIYGTGKRQVLSVPQEAVIGDTSPFVFVIGPDSRLERRQIKTGIQDDEYVEVQSGVAENETVVVVGKYAEFEPGMKVQVMQQP